jgi:uncharacterized protein YlxW (UPF0749 family)
MWRFIAPLALGLCGVLLVTSARAADGSDLRGSGLTELSDLVRVEERRTQELSAEIDQLAAEVDELTEGGAEEAGRNGDVDEELRATAGLSAVQGPALSVTLDDAPIPERRTEGTEVEDYIVHQQDLEAVINALWAGGAEAMMLMDQRIISTSSVKCVGPVLFLQGKRYAPPYTVTAIGDAAALQAALDESPGVREYERYADLLGLGFEVTSLEQITMPGYDGAIGISPETASL